MKQRNPWKTACLLLATGVLGAGTFLFAGEAWHVKATEDTQVVPSELVLNPVSRNAVTAEEEKPMEIPQDQSVPEDMLKEPSEPVPPPLTERTMEGPHKNDKKTAKLVVHVMDGRTGKPLEGAEVVLIETAERFKTDATGTTPSIDAPVIREERYAEQVARIHGQLGLIAYKNGYRDSITFGVRMHEGRVTDVTMWMYQIGPGDRRIEPVFYHSPYHHLFLIELAEYFRSPSQPGAGRESPDR
jgi:hypothetical protein